MHASTPAVQSVRARKILDSRAEWTVEAEIDGFFGAAPAGASKGSFEARTIDPEKSVAFINGPLGEKLIGVPLNQGKIDAILEKNLQGLGSNGSVALSYAAYNALWDIFEGKGRTLVFPYPLGNVFGGGAHGGSIDIQEILVCPLEAQTFPDAIDRMTKAYHSLKKYLIKEGVYTGTNDEGALIGKIDFEKVLGAACRISSALGCRVGLDVAASQLWNGKKYIYKNSGASRTTEEQIEYIKSIAGKYNLFYIEDPLHEDDFEGFAPLREALKKTLVVGDDLTVTSTTRLSTAIKKHSISGIIIKPNQVGTVSLACEAVTLAQKCGIVPVISHRSAEATDATISRIALGEEIPYIKAGVADIRVAKLNKLLRMWDSAEKKRMAKV